jgi:aminopeptidase N
MKLKYILLNAALTFAAFAAYAQDAVQPADPLMKIYRATPPMINDLVHTKLAVRFDYKKCFLYGKEWLTLKPHFYPTDTLRLDAKGMDLHQISLLKNGRYIPLKFSYDSVSIAIHLDKVYHENEPYTVFIDYTAKPNRLTVKGSAAMSGARGLYFINPDGGDKDKPTQIWTQGETQGSSAWFPTIDQPDQKTTDEISLTVPAKYVTLSNGRLASQKINADDTRTDTWKMELPQSPYLFMMAVGDFKIYHDHWRNKTVDYYLEPKYAPYAKAIFGNTPEMMEFYSKTLGVDFPWNKYAQVVVRDYLYGAMENTTATLHGEQVQKTGRELIDEYYGESQTAIAHELFHQWFGDYVTCKDWSNITVNESFADFSEMLWAAHKYGKDEGDAYSYKEMTAYLNAPDGQSENLVRYHYSQPEDVFDVVTYQKGGRVLNMLRNYLGDGAFFKGLHLYLTANAFKSGDAQKLRLAFEEASGLDLNWYFNQWYYGAGNPELNISYQWNAVAKTETVVLQQSQTGQVFKLPMAIDIYANGKKERYQHWMNGKSDTMVFKLSAKPELVNVDADKVLLAQKSDHKTLDEYVFQYFNAPLYLDRFEAIDTATANQDNTDAQKVLLAALNDKYYGLRIKAIKAIHADNKEALPIILGLAKADSNTLVRAAAITFIGKQKNAANMPLFYTALNSRSYAIQGAALIGINLQQPEKALGLAKSFEGDNKGALSTAIVVVYAGSGSDAEWPYVYKAFSDADTPVKSAMVKSFASMAGRVMHPSYAQQGIASIEALGIKYKAYGAAPMFIGLLNKIAAQRTQMNDGTSANTATDAIKQITEAK